MRKIFDRTVDVTNYRYARNNMYPADDPSFCRSRHSNKFSDTIWNYKSLLRLRERTWNKSVSTEQIGYGPGCVEFLGITIALVTV